MEFLDSKKRKKKARQLLFGYGLLTVLVLLATYILVATTLGYEIFTTKGQVIQNGLLFVASEPVPAVVSINGKPEDEKTEVRLALPAGEYLISLNEDGYGSWSKKITVEGGKVKFASYPRLIPTTLASTELANLPDATGFTTQSPDRKWLVVQQNAALPAIEIFDLSKDKPAPVAAVLPTSLLVNVDGNYGTYETIEWSDDNRHFLLLQKLPDGRQNFLMIDRENIDASINVNTHFGVTPTKVTLFDKKPDKLYLYFSENGLLRLADVEAKTIATPILDQVLTYQSYSDELLLYTTTKDATAGKVTVKIRENETSYNLGDLAFDSANRYFLDFTQYDGSWYYVIGSGSSDRALVYKNPLNFLKANEPKVPALLATLRSGTPESVKFSSNSRFILSSSGQSIAVYDAEEDVTYRYDLPFVADAGSKISWVDGFHLQGVSAGKVQFFEFDGLNLRELSDTKGVIPGYFDRDYEKLFTISKKSDGTSVLNLTGLVKTEP